jgi:hypothetical protein
MDHKRLRAGIGHQVAKFVERVVPVYRNGVSTDLPRAHARFEKRDIVAKAKRDAISSGDTNALESGGRLRNSTIDVTGFELTIPDPDRGHKPALLDCCKTVFEGSSDITASGRPLLRSGRSVA